MVLVILVAENVYPQQVFGTMLYSLIIHVSEIMTYTVRLSGRPDYNGQRLELQC